MNFDSDCIYNVNLPLSEVDDNEKFPAKIEILEQGAIDVVLVSLLLALNIFHTLF